jgi:hypothetical protein
MIIENATVKVKGTDSSPHQGDHCIGVRANHNTTINARTIPMNDKIKVIAIMNPSAR